MKRYILLPLTGLLILISACTKDFDKINTNPNALAYIDPEYLMTNTLRRGSLDDNSYFYTIGIGNFYSQYYTSVKDEFNWNLDAYYQNDNWYGTMWKYWYAEEYTGFLSIADEALKLARFDGYPNKIAPPIIWKSFLFQRLTDCFGDISFSEAFNDNINFPRYDDQKDVYFRIISQLDSAVRMMTESSKVKYGSGDLLYQGNITKWQRFGNSLRLRMAMRMVKVEPQKARQEFEAALAADAGPMASNADNAKIYPDPQGPAGIHSQNPLKIFASAFDWVRVSKSFVYKMKTLDDPRMWNYVDPTLNFVTKTLRNRYLVLDVASLTAQQKEYVQYVIENTSSISTSFEQGRYFIDDALRFLSDVIGVPASEIDTLKAKRYIGAASGYTLDKLNTIQGTLSSMSDYGQYLQGATQPCFLMVYPEICFLKAEAALRGWNAGGSAENLYNDGIRAALELYEVPDNEIIQYLNGPAKYNPAASQEKQLEQIITQKYLANYLNGFESWAEWRRTGYPKLDPIQTDEGDTRSRTAVPRRFLYIQDEKIMNGDNVNSARNNQIKYSLSGQYDMLTPVWWDQKYTLPNF